MAKVYRAALVGCSRMGAFIDNEVRSSRSIVLPYSHAAGYAACARTELVAGADLRPEVLAAFGERYGVGPSHLYTDYREMIERERPEILSVATQPEQRAEVILFAAERGVRALYVEKALCASMAEADAIRAAVERHGIALNMGTNRRWHPGFDAMRDLIASGEVVGALKTLVIYSTGALFNTATHWFDAVMRLNGDAPAAWVQAYLPKGDEVIQGDEVTADPAAQGAIAFANGVMAHALLSPRPNDIEAICEGGVLTARNGGASFELHRLERDGERRLVASPFPAYTPASTTLRLIEDLVRALDTGAPPRGGAAVAWANTELLFACIESHRRGGVRVPLPLPDRTLRLVRRGFVARQPRYTP
jgi:predicted dehydrogenase